MLGSKKKVLHRNESYRANQLEFLRFIRLLESYVFFVKYHFSIFETVYSIFQFCWGEFIRIWYLLGWSYSYLYLMCVIIFKTLFLSEFVTFWLIHCLSQIKRSIWSLLLDHWFMQIGAPSWHNWWSRWLSIHKIYIHACLYKIMRIYSFLVNIN